MRCRSCESNARAAYQKYRESAKSIAVAEMKLTETLGLDHLDLTSQKFYSRSFSELQASNRFGAEYYMPCKKRVLDALSRLSHRTIADHAPAVREKWDPTRVSEDDIVRNFDLTDALEPFLDDETENLRLQVG